MHLFPRSDLGSKILVQYLVCTKHISKAARGALEHHWYPLAVRIKSGALPMIQAGSVTRADRRGADRGTELTIDSCKWDSGCRTIQIEGLKDFGAAVPRWQSERCR